MTSTRGCGSGEIEDGGVEPGVECVGKEGGSLVEELLGQIEHTVSANPLRGPNAGMEPPIGSGVREWLEQRGLQRRLLARQDQRRGPQFLLTHPGNNSVIEEPPVGMLGG